MKNSTFKLLMMACVLFITGHLNAQVKLGDKPEVGQTYVTDSVTQTSTLTINFNTNKPETTWEQVNDTTVNFNWSTCQNNKGFQAAVYASDTTGAPKVNPNDKFKVRSGRFRSNENPGHIANVDSLQSILNKWQEVNPGSPDSAVYTVNAPSACLFDVDGDTTNQAYGIQPGIYKKLENEMVFSFKNLILASDFSFTLNTYDAGNTGKTASYDLEVKFGSTDSTITGFYVTGSGMKDINLAEAFGWDKSVFDGQSEVHIILKTDGTGTPIQDGVYDPTVVIDDISVSFALPAWVVPNAGIAGNAILDNSNDPLSGILNQVDTFAIHLQDTNRSGSLKITNNMLDNTNKLYTFLDTMTVMANDGSGNYNVPVNYTFNPAVYDAGTATWSEGSISILGPNSGTVDDDIMVYFTATPTSLDPMKDRFELDNGTRIWYDVSIKGVEAPTVQEWNISDADFNALGTLTAPVTVNGLSIYASDAKPVTIDANNKSIDGMDFTSRLKLGGSGLFTDGTPTARILAFDVTGNTTITIAGMSSSSSADRELTITAGSMDNVIGTFPAMGASIGKQDFEYKGGPTTIYMFSPSSGVNIYYIKAVTPAPVPAKKVAYVTADKTMAATAASPENDPIIKMLQADPNFDVTVMKVAADSVFSLDGYDVVVAQEGFGSSSAIFKPGGSLGLENIKVPFIYNKAYALKDGKAVTSATASASEMAGQLYMEVPAASQTSKLFSGITFSSDSIMLFKTGAADDGSASDVKAYSYALDLEMSDASTLLAKPKGSPDNISVCINDIPKGTVLGTEDTLQARMIAISENFGAICKDNGTNLTDEGLTVWRNALYMAAGLEVPTTMFQNVSTLDTLYASTGMLSPTFDASKTAYQLNLPMGTSSVKLTAKATSDMATVKIMDAGALSNGMDTEASVTVVNPLGNDSTTYMVYIHVQSDNEVAYLSNSNDNVLATAMPYDQNPVSMLKDAGYSVTFLNKNSLVPNGDTRFDYTPYKALVIGAGVSSSLITYFAQDNYPIPCVCMQPDAPRSDKWGWTGSKKSDGKQMYVTKSYDVDSAKIDIINNSHYITANYQVGDWVTWTLGTPDSTDWSGKELKSYNLTDSIPDAVGLGRIPADGGALTSIWAVTNGLSVRSLQMDNSYTRVDLANRVVLLYVFNDGLSYASSDFSPLLTRSLEWVLGASPNGISPLDKLTESLDVYPNPATNYVKVKFTLNQQKEVSLNLFNLTGQLVEISRTRILNQGVNEISVNTSNLKSGLYLYRLKVGSDVVSGKLNIVR